MSYTVIDYSEVRHSEKPKIKMLTNCSLWSKGVTYTVLYEDENPLSRNLYFRDNHNGTTIMNTRDEGKDFVWVKDAKKELRESLRKSMK